MHEQNIETLRDEALRLIDIEINVLNKMLSEPGVITDAKPGEKQTFDRVSTPKHIEVLTGERSKLDDLEMVVAVVGTMKAGKSTSINAIVGTEVLPNRNRPMTALPTLIRHTPGQMDPILKFDNHKPIQQLLDTLRKSLNQSENREILRGMRVDSDMNDLLEIIESGHKYQTLYKGSEAIFDFLKGLNDLVRLSRELEIEFPFTDYDEIHELPVIEVEFAHLRELTQAKGRLTLLDTPGPNESGQPHLKKMLKEQLSKTSAVLAILDFTQLKSDADEDVRRELMEIANVSKGRLYTLVNKFDQKDRHGDTEEEVKTFVAENLMSGNILAKNVYPVSSRWGYLANRARHELLINKKLPDPDKQAWVADFGEEAFGRRWEAKISDSEEVKKSADALWQDSLFDAPLDGVIRTAHARAAAYAVDAAAAKLVDMAEKIGNILNVRESALTKSVQELQVQIKALQDDADRVDFIESDSKKKAEMMLEELTNGTGLLFEKIRKDVDKTIEKYFKEGKSIEKSCREMEKKNSENERSSSGLAKIFSDFLGRSNVTNFVNNNDFDPTSPIITLKDFYESNCILNKIGDAISTIINTNESVMKIAMSEIVNAFQANFHGDIIFNAKLIIDGMKGRLGDNGFSIEFRVPDAKKLSLGFSGAEMMENIITEKQETVTKRRRKSGIWGGLCEWFNTKELGWESYEVEQPIYEIDLRKIKKSINKSVNNAFSGLNNAVADYIKIPLYDGINEFFDSLRGSVEQIRGDLMQSIRDQEKSKAEREALMSRLKEINKNVPNLVADGRDLETDVKPLVNSAAFEIVGSSAEFVGGQVITLSTTP